MTEKRVKKTTHARKKKRRARNKEKKGTKKPERRKGRDHPRARLVEKIMASHSDTHTPTQKKNIIHHSIVEPAAKRPIADS